MKRGIILLLLLVLMIPAVSASITITGPSQATYNIGDTLDVTGYILQDESLSGFLQFSIVCGNETYPLQLTSVDVAAGDQVQFEELSLPPITVTSSMEGLCKVQAEILVSGVTVELDSSTSFDVTKELEGSFSLDKSQLQLGDSFTLDGTIFQLDGDSVGGTAELYFETEDTEYLVGFLDIVDGQLLFEHTFLTGYSGLHYINLIVRDSYGNEEMFNAAAEFTVVDQLEVDVRTNTDSIYPGEHVNVFGDVNTLAGNSVSAGSVEIGLSEEIHSTALEDSQYTYDVFTTDDIVSGDHTLRVTVEDSFGNTGSSTTTITIKPRGTTADIVLTNTSLNPGEAFDIVITLYDQAGMVMGDGVNLQVLDANGDVISDREVFSGETVPYQLDEASVPGDWTVTMSYTDPQTLEETITEELTFNVVVVNAVDYYILGETLYVTNIGNVKYTDDIEVTVSNNEGETYVISRSRNLDIGETIEIELAQEVPTGTYSVIPTGYASGEWGDVAVTNGKPRQGLGWLYTLLAIVFILGLAYVLYWRVGPKKDKKGKKDDKKKEEEWKEVGPKTKKPEPKKATTDPKKKKDLNFKSTEEDREDFKRRTLEEIKKTEEKIKKSENKDGLRGGTLGYVTGRKDPGVRTTPPPPKDKGVKVPPPPPKKDDTEAKSAFALFD